MVISKVRNWLSLESVRVRAVSVGVVSLAAIALGSFSACSQGDTDGGTSGNDGGIGDPFVSDGGAGASLEIEIKEDHLSVGETSGFFVRLRDAAGNPIPFIRIFCESEKGVAIVEPSSGGVAFESTGADGSMSGVIGGLLPGSFLMECRAQQGFNLYDRVTVHVGGEVPVGFQGFPGAAGGNLGGGVIVDDVPEVDDGVGLRITGVSFRDAGGETSAGPLDLTRDADCDNDVTTTGDAEPFTYTVFSVSVANDSDQLVFIRSVRFLIKDSGDDAQTSRQTQSIEIAAGADSTVTGILNTSVNCATTSASQWCYAGTSTLVEPGTWGGTVTITGEDVNGTEFTLERDFTIQWDYVNNCA